MRRRTSPKSSAQPARGQNLDRRQRRSAETRERLFRAALKLFADKGFAETTVEDITNAADVGKGTFFNYFPSKEHILIAFSDMQLSKLQTTVDQMRERPEPMRSFFRSLTLRMTEEPAKAPDVVRAILQANLSSSSVRTVMRERNARAEGLLTQLVQIGRERGEFRRDLPALELAQVFRQTIFGTLLMWSLYGDASLAERIEQAMEILWMGIAPREPVTTGSPQS
ncbi:MAG: TetR/AcrR family transcriptional regulator [Candidatus Acidiferrum sp.]|jgi:AcrR family transcriptional regulator